MAIVSAGHANSFGHPAPEVVQRYLDAGALVLDTGHDGAVTIETDGSQVLVRTQSGRRLHYEAGRPGCARRAS